MTIAEALELVKRLERENSELRGEAQSSKEQAGRLERRVEQLQEQLEALLKRQYSRSSERFVDPNQRDLFEELLKLEELRELEEKPQEREKIEYERKRPRKRGPKPLQIGRAHV